MEGVNQEYLDNLKTKVHNKIENVDLYQFKGSVSKLVGLTVEVKLPGLKIGDLCYIEAATGEKKPAEVVAFKGDAAQLLLLYDGAGIGQGSLVTTTGKPIIIPVGDFLLGRLINPMGDPIDGKPMNIEGALWRPVEGPPPGPFERPIITEMFSTGVRAIDACLTFGCGQRMGLFAGSGVGKSTLLKVILGLEIKATGNVDFISSAGEKFIPNLDEIGYISQTSVLLPGSIRDNITMFSHDRNTTNKTNEYVKKMCFSVDISSFSEGLDTQIKSNDENWLSGGQKQKIILIRNSMFDRPIFLIDEATSAIDEAARVQVIKEFLNTSATVLWIEHNLSKKITNLFDRQIYLRK